VTGRLGRRRRRSSVLAIAITSLTAAVGLQGCGGEVSSESAPAGAPVVVTPIDRYQISVHTEVERGDTIESVSRRLAGDDWQAWRDALTTELDPRRLIPGTTFEGQQSSSGRLESLRVELDRRTELQLEAAAEGIQVNRVERPISSTVERLEGEVNSSLFEAVEAAGGRPELAVLLAEVFQWDVDFIRDVRSGDRFVALVERQTVDGSFYGYGPLFAARFVNDGRVLDAIAYPDAGGRVGYYDLEGRPLRKQFLRSPLKFSRVTSRFSLSRFHPILKRRMPHYGVDYGAPVGTPVLVTADGKVTFAGSKSGAGRMVTVRHANGYETNYLHLSRYGSGIRAGVRVGQGQVIGFVGSSGLSTAPHLDYRVRHNGQWINPLTISSPPAQPLDEARLQRFLSHVVALIVVLEGGAPPAGAQC
jgi:murein DD-endopeptidase MepM/ murein hydrolase activator NlpD